MCVQAEHGLAAVSEITRSEFVNCAFCIAPLPFSLPPSPLSHFFSSFDSEAHVLLFTDYRFRSSASLPFTLLTLFLLPSSQYPDIFTLTIQPSLPPGLMRRSFNMDECSPHPSPNQKSREWKPGLGTGSGTGLEAQAASVSSYDDDMDTEEETKKEEGKEKEKEAIPDLTRTPFDMVLMDSRYIHLHYLYLILSLPLSSSIFLVLYHFFFLYLFFFLFL